ncbi:MAG TPA: hypothetical protein VHL09_00375 [Dehalococcoidia bacterium]|nr:hypothetical protein [Dehalococcoidia bacterium]
MAKPDRRGAYLSTAAGPLLAELIDVECESAFWRAVNQVIAYVPEPHRAELTEALLAATTAWAAEMTQRALDLAVEVRVGCQVESDRAEQCCHLPAGPEVH